MPFLNVVDPAFDFTAPEVFAAQAAGWWADSPLGPAPTTSTRLPDGRASTGSRQTS